VQLINRCVNREEEGGVFTKILLGVFSILVFAYLRESLNYFRECRLAFCVQFMHCCLNRTVWLANLRLPVSRDDHSAARRQQQRQQQQQQKLEAAQKPKRKLIFLGHGRSFHKSQSRRRQRRRDVEKQLKVASSLWHAPTDRKRQSASQPPFVFFFMLAFRSYSLNSAVLALLNIKCNSI